MKSLLRSQSMNSWPRRFLQRQSGVGASSLGQLSPKDMRLRFSLRESSSQRDFSVGFANQPSRGLSSVAQCPSESPEVGPPGAASDSTPLTKKLIKVISRLVSSKEEAAKSSAVVEDHELAKYVLAIPSEEIPDLVRVLLTSSKPFYGSSSSSSSKIAKGPIAGAKLLSKVIEGLSAANRNDISRSRVSEIIECIRSDKLFLPTIPPQLIYGAFRQVYFQRCKFVLKKKKGRKEKRCD